MSRAQSFDQSTSETRIKGSLNLDGTGDSSVDTGLGFLDHMLSTLAKHGRFDLVLETDSDLHVDDHHTVEDCAIVIGRCLDSVLGERSGIRRFGYAYAPLDETLSRAVVDLSGRPWAEIEIPFSRPSIGAVATENLIHFFATLAAEGRMAIHLDLLRGSNNHHMAEACFKAMALALADAVAKEGSTIRSTKGTLK